MKVSFEYGQGMVDAVLPDSTDIFIPGETVPDPPCIPEDKLEEETLFFVFSYNNHITYKQ